MKRTLKITAIREGTVIDHISADNTFKVADFLNLNNGGNVVTVGMNLESKKLGKKGVIKIGERFLNKDEVNKIALIAPEANINIIRDYNVKEKFRVEIPEVIEGVIRCANTNCVTNDQHVKTKFYVISKDPLRIRCHYCERSMGKDEIEVA